ncbi:MAG: hypothetical protein ACREAN_01935, partial [Nitrosopumilaceae archaeon]
FLPVSYIVVASLFGQRLWVHHYSVLVPFQYLFIGMLFGEFTKSKKSTVFSITLFIILISINLIQSNIFYRKLDETGGVGKMSDAINLFALDALHKQNTLYIFPEWGFYMPFDFLTKNSVPYILQADPMIISSYKTEIHTVVLAYWSIQSTTKYESILRRADIRNIKLNVYLQRNKVPAFYTLSGDIKNP